VNDLILAVAGLFAGIGLWTAIGVTLVAGLMRGFAGFGSAMLMAPIFAILFGSADMVVTVVAIEMVVSVQLFPQVRRNADWRTLAPMSIAACAAMPLGVWLLASVDKGTIVTAVSAVIVAFVVLMWSGWKYRGRRSAFAGAAVGAVSGAMMATTSVGAIILFPVMAAGAWAGGRLFHGLASERLYRNVTLGILFATGMFGLLRNLLV